MYKQIFIRKYRSSLNLVQVLFLTELCPLEKEIKKKFSFHSLTLKECIYMYKVDIVYRNILQENRSQFRIWSRSILCCTCMAILTAKCIEKQKTWGENNHVYIISEKVPCLLHVVQIYM